MTIQKIEKIIKNHKYCSLIHFPGNNKFVILEHKDVNGTNASRSKEIATFDTKKEAINYWTNYIKTL